MQTLNNFSPPTRNGQTPKDTIKNRIYVLRIAYGDCLNRWPLRAQAEYLILARQLRQIEGVQ